MDETYMKVEGVWKSLYRAVDSEGKTINFLFTAKRERQLTWASSTRQNRITTFQKSSWKPSTPIS